MIKEVIFDVDGTLLNTEEGILSSAKYAIEEHGKPMPSDNILRTFIGPPIADSFAKEFNVKGKELSDMVKTFRDRYKGEDLLKAKPYPGIYDVLDGLRQSGLKAAVATYKRQDYAETIMRHFGFDSYTDIIYGADSNNKLKKKDIIRNCITAAGIESGEAVMVGDSDNDAIGAESLGIKFIAVTYGFGFHSRSEAERYANNGIAESTKQIAEIIGRLKQQGE